MRAGALVVLALTLGAAKAEPIILIDHEWNVRYAKFACEKARVDCTGDPTLAVHMFEGRIKRRRPSPPSVRALTWSNW